MFKVDYKEKMVKKYRLESGVEFYLIEEYERGQHHAFVVRDPHYGQHCISDLGTRHGINNCQNNRNKRRGSSRNSWQTSG